MDKPETIKIDDVEYVRADKQNEPAVKLDGMEYVIVRSYAAGVFAGYMESREGKEVLMRNVRRIWYWDGACSISQMAMEGVKAPQNCKFSMPVDKQIITEACEIISCTKKAQAILEAVIIWKK